MTNESKHTPGPWRIERSPPSGIFGADGSFILRQPAINTSTHTGAEVEAFLARREADGRLIAAAPDLLAALEALVNEHEEYTAGDPYEDGTVGGLYAEARAAIAKARGEAVPA